MPKKSSESATAQERLIAALNHPARVKALTILTERTASASEIAAEIRLPLSNISYHVRELAKFGLIEVVEEEPVRGSVETFYRAVTRPLFEDCDWEAIDPPVRGAVSRFGIHAIANHGIRSFNANLFDARPDRHLSRTPLLLDEEGWRNVAAIQNKALKLTLEEQAASDGRRSSSREAGIHAVAAMACFEVPSPRRGKSPRR